MRTSEQCDKVLPALFAALADMPDPKKNKKNAHLKNEYADLGAVMECMADPLREHGLVVTRTMSPAGVLSDTQAVLEIRVWHTESGQWVCSDMPLVMEKQTGHAYGSAISYASRYGLKALFGMVDTDDDGNAASGYERKPKREPVEVIEPFGMVEEAEAALASIKTRQDLKRWSVRVKASGFQDNDRERALDLHSQKKQELG